MNLLQKLKLRQVNKLSIGKPQVDFRSGDTIRVAIKFKEGERERTQFFEGVVIGRKTAVLTLL